VAATLVTVATPSVVAATPSARHSVVHFVDAVTQTAAPAKPDRPVHDVRKPATVAVEPVAHAAATPKPHARQHQPQPAPAKLIVHAAKEPAVPATPAAVAPETLPMARPAPRAAPIVATSAP